MADDRWQRVQGLFEEAVRLPPQERSSFLTEACGNDAELRTEVESLLEHDQQAGGDFMLPSDSTRTVETDGEATPASPHVRIEGYEVVRELNRGAQGVVYQAIQQATKQKVAIKVLLEGPHASKSAQKRFEREIELIAQLKHPNIIGIFHSGMTVDGRRFYVMDYVRGLPLNHHVREKKLTLEETLELFATVCEAVRSAHQKGVIHRDLKPANIIVDANGTPKILDFGLAKWLAAPAEPVVSITEQVVGTLPYVSPEQARGNPDEIDTRTDVYALGVILYELLTGHFPYPVVGQMIDVLRHITETPPTPPSRRWKPDSGITRRSSRKPRIGRCPIDDDVQTIVLKALSKERERRYQSASELIRDIQHYLRGEPIEAKSDSFWYVLRKTTRRNLVQTAVAASVLIILGSAVTVVLGYAHSAKEAQHKQQASQQVAAREVSQMRGMADEYRQGALAWFLIEWWAGRLESARVCGQHLAVTAPQSPEAAAMAFLLRDDLPFDQLLQKVGDDHAVLAYFALGERFLRDGEQAQAQHAFRQALSAEPEERWQVLLEARLRQLEHHAEEPSDVTEAGEGE